MTTGEVLPLFRTFTLVVTDEEAAEGERKQSGRCPAALAFRKRFQASFVAVWNDSTMLTAFSSETRTWESFHFRHGPLLSKAIREYDASDNPKPFPPGEYRVTRVA